MKARRCDDCTHGSYSPALKQRCAMGHKPRFHVPSSDPRDTDWGYKRTVCAVFSCKIVAAQWFRAFLR